jgi:hypothetical protein
VIRPSPDTNDHEVRFLADGVDLIARHWGDMKGLDPDDIIVDPCPLHSGDASVSVTIARCSCGVVGCGSVEVEIRRSPDYVVWECAERGQTNHPLRLCFVAESYEAEVERALHDHSWETPDRTAARLLASMVERDQLARYHLTYSWASGRIRARTFTVSLNLEPGPFQVLVHVPWDGQSAQKIAQTCRDLLAQPPDAWPEVVWHAQGADRTPPPFNGPGWRQAG